MSRDQQPMRAVSNAQLVTVLPGSDRGTTALTRPWQVGTLKLRKGPRRLKELQLCALVTCCGTDAARKQQAPLWDLRQRQPKWKPTPFFFFCYISTRKIPTDERRPLQSVMRLCVSLVGLTLNEWGHWHFISDSDDSMCDYLAI